jgi:SAM-dependent methyltransferase
MKKFLHYIVYKISESFFKSKFYSFFFKTSTNWVREKKIGELINLGCGLDIGAGKRKYGNNIVRVDIEPEASPDIVADIHYLPFKYETFDFIIFTSVLEHIRKPWQASEEIYRVLKNGGILYCEVPFLQPFHPHPYDLYRFSHQGVSEFFNEKFKTIELGVASGPIVTLGKIIPRFFASFFSNRIVYNIVLLIVSLPFSLMKPLDRFFIKNERFWHLASTFYYKGKKIR